jgi:hypothetical protein
MENFSLNEVPKEDLQALGLMKDDKVLLDDDTLKQLLKGELTDFVKFDNININGKEKLSLDAKLSLHKKEDGNVSLLIHPIYNELNIPKELSTDEAKLIQEKGITEKAIAGYGKLIDFGNTNYQNDPKNKPSFFVELETFDGRKTKLWGVELQKALEDSNLKKGELIQVSHLGKEAVLVDVPLYDDKNVFIKNEEKLVDKNLWAVEPFSESKKTEKSLLFEYDKETKSFVSVEASTVKPPHQINGQNLSENNKEEFKKGKKVLLEDGTEIQYSPTAKNSIRSNKKLLIASLLLDGGLIYLVIKSATLLGSKLEKQKETEYSKGYLEALKKVQNDLERKAHNFPNDKRIQNDLNSLKGEINRFTTASSPAQTKENSVNDVLEKVNDPEIENTLKQEKSQQLKEQKVNNPEIENSPENLKVEKLKEEKHESSKKVEVETTYKIGR